MVLKSIVPLKASYWSRLVCLLPCLPIKHLPYLILCFYDTCQPKAMLTLKFFNKVQDKQNSLDKKVKKLEAKLNSISQSISIQPTASNLEKSNQPSQSNQLAKFTSHQPVTLSASKFLTNAPDNSVDQKFNLVIYRLDKS